VRVVFVQKFVPHYRLPFFERFRDELTERGIEFLLIYGEPDAYEGSKVRMEYPEWGTKVNSRIVKLAGRFLYWQGIVSHIRKGDLVIVEQAAKLIDNYVLYALCRFGYIRMGYFGHGENFQSDDELFISGWLKRRMLINVTRWFAYTELTRTSLLKQGVPDGKISVVNNTLLPPENLTTHEIQKVPGRFLYIGGLYFLKRLDLVFDGFALASKNNPSLELHVVGDGPDRTIAEKAAAENPQVTYHGSLYGEERNAMIASADAILMPGLVGLVAVDSFFFNTPILTSHAGQHSPEVAYLENNVNALFDGEDGNAQSYGQLIEQFASEEGLKEKLQLGCQNSVDLYSMNNMVQRFCDGVESVFSGGK